MTRYDPALVDRFLAQHWRYHPVDATFMGDRAHDHLLPPVGSAVVTEEKAALALLLRDVAATEEPADLGQRLDRRMMLAELTVQAAQAEQRHRFGNPAWFTAEAAFGVISLLLPQSAPIRHDELLSRLEAIPGFLDEGARLLADRAVPHGWTARAVREAGAVAEFLRTDFRLHEDFADDWAEPAGNAADAFQRFAAAIAQLPDADPACGPAYLQMLLETQHSFSLSPDELLRKAEAAFAALGDEMDEMAARIARGRSAAQIITGLSDDHPDDAEAVIDAYLDWDVRAVVASDGLVTPAQDYDLDYRWMAPCFRKVSQSLYFLFYRSPPGLNAGAGSVYWVTPPGADSEAFLRGNSIATIKTIHAVHHGSVGHHTQNTRARAADSRLARIGGTDCSMGLAFLGAGTLIEGWACYVEDLLMEAPGFYTPAETLLLKHYERRNAASVIVDIKLHLREWSLAEAMAFYRDKAGFAPARVEAEVVRNSMFPSSRLMYWAGVEGIKLLRKRFAGTTTEFHDTLLSFGHMPLAWIGEELARAGRLG